MLRLIKGGRADDRVLFSACETVFAGPRSFWHIRQVGPEGLKPSGGVTSKALCGRDLRGGWDIPGFSVKVSDTALDPRMCTRCVAEMMIIEEGDE